MLRRILLPLLLCTSSYGGALPAPADQPAWSTTDNIRIDRVQQSGNRTGEKFIYSPDGSLVAFVLERALLESDTVESTLFVYTVADLQAFAAGGQQPEPRAQLKASNVKSRPGIGDVAWSENGRLLLFLRAAADGGAVQAWDGTTGTIRQIGPDRIYAYQALGDRMVLFAARADEAKTAASPETSVVVTGRSLTSIFGESKHEIFRPKRIVLAELGDGSHREYTVAATPVFGVSASPDGVHLAFAEPIEARWRGGCWALASPTPTAVFSPQQVALLNTRTGAVTRPLGGPIAASVLGGGPGNMDGLVKWSPSGRAAIVPYAFTEKQACTAGARAAQPGTYWISPDTAQAEEIATWPLTKAGEAGVGPIATTWDRAERRVFFQLGAGKDPVYRDGAPKDPVPSRIGFERSGDGWGLTKDVPARTATSETPRVSPVLEVKQALSEPPRLVALAKGGKSRELLDLAPHAAQRNLGEVREISWTDRNGRTWRGFLALPRQAQGRLPLIVQTHGELMKADDFLAEGNTTSAYPGRAALARGFAVLTTNDLSNSEAVEGAERASEASRLVESYRAAVEHLDRQGIIDPRRVGVIGWSRTSYYVKQALVEHPDLFAAAVAADGVDYGLGQLILWNDTIATYSRQYVATYGDLGDRNVGEWIAPAPNANVARITAPVRVEAYDAVSSLFGEWEFYSLLRLLGRPVDLVAYPDGAHALYIPSQRLASTQGSLDWFDFWLNGYEDPAPEKRAQYERWRLMRSEMLAARPHQVSVSGRAW